MQWFGEGNSMNMKIRPMTAEDRSSVIDMMRVFYASPAVLSNGSEEIFLNDVENCVNDSPYLEGYIFEATIDEQGISTVSMNGPKAACLEMSDNKEISCDKLLLGYGMVAKSFSTEFGKPCMWIEDLYLKEEYRGLGFGSQFLNYIAEKYEEAILRLEVEEDNERAIRTYKKCGFEELPYMEMKK